MYAPLEGIEVVDLTHVWAGPQCTSIFAGLGASVIKVENPKTPDRWRGPVNGSDHLHRYPDGVAGDEPYNRNALFNSINLNKRDITLDLKTSKGKKILEGLLKKADVLAENFRPGVLARLGFSLDALKTINDKLIVLSLSGYGATGPYKMFTAYGSTLDPMAGMSALNSYDGETHSLCGISVCDPIGGFAGACAVLTEILRQKENGNREFKWLDISQYEASVLTVMEPVMDSIEKDLKNEKIIQKDTSYILDDFYPCQGDDEWVAITVRDQKCLDTIRELIDYKVESGIDDLRNALRNWTSKIDKYTITMLLQKNGIAAGPVLGPKDILNDKHFNARGYWQKINHPKVGMRPHASIPIMADGERIKYLAPAPCLGEHTEEVLRELGYQSIENLKVEGVI